MAVPLGPPPLCACGCGQPTKRVQRHRRYARYIRNHHLKALNETKRGAATWNWRGGERRSNGYVFIRFDNHPRGTSDGKYVKRAILVLEERLGRQLRLDEEAHHKNEVKDDDRPDNLEPLTKPDHMRLHMTRRPAVRGEQSGRAKLTEDQVQEIRALAEAGVSVAELARRYGLTHQGMTAVVTRHSWAHVA